MPSKNVFDSGPGTSDIEIREYLRYNVYRPQAAVKVRRVQYLPMRSDMVLRKSGERRERGSHSARQFIGPASTKGPVQSRCGQNSRVRNAVWNLGTDDHEIPY